MNYRFRGYVLLSASVVFGLLLLSTLDGQAASALGQGYVGFAFSMGKTLTFLGGGVPFGIAVTLDAALALVGVGMIAFKRE